MQFDSIVAAIRKRHGLGSDSDVNIKGLSSDIDVDSGDQHSFTARITTDGVDRDREVLLPAGCDATDFEKCGAIFWNHNYDQPIGVASKLSRGDRWIDGRGSFLKRPDDWEGDFFPDFARAFVRQMKAAGRSCGVSVGFVPKEARVPTRDDKAMYGEDVRRVISKWKLLEWSIAPVQANPQAMVQSIGKSLSPECVKALFPELSTTNKTYHFVIPRLPAPVDIEATVRESVSLAVAKKSGRLFV